MLLTAYCDITKTGLVLCLRVPAASPQLLSCTMLLITTLPHYYAWWFHSSWNCVNSGSLRLKTQAPLYYVNGQYVKTKYNMPQSLRSPTDGSVVSEFAPGTLYLKERNI